MKKIKFHVKDEDGNSYLVEEIQEKKDYNPEIMDDETEETPVLTESEITALRQLAGRAEDLLKLLDIEKEEHESTADDEEDDEEEKEIIDEDEEVIETDKEKKVTHDAKKSFGAIEKKKSTNDSFDDKELEVEASWIKRFGGK